MRPFDSAAVVDVRHLSSLALSCEAALLLLSTEGLVVGWLGAAEALFGYDVDEAMGMAHGHFFGLPDDGAMQRTRFQAGATDDGHWCLRKDGSRFRAVGAMDAILDENGDSIGSTLFRYITVFTHELRNQLMPLVAGLSMLDRARDGSAPSRAISTMARKVHVMTRLIDDLVDALRSPTSAPSISLSIVKIQSVLALAADHVADLVSRKSQRLVVTMPEAALMIEADEHRLDQLLGNLLSNASKFTDMGGIIRLSATLEEGMVSIRVEDNGCGIGSDVLPRVFDLFVREDRAGSPPGFGVGLAVVKQIVELHGGTVAGESAGPRLGSVFTVRLPLRQS